MEREFEESGKEGCGEERGKESGKEGCGKERGKESGKEGCGEERGKEGKEGCGAKEGALPMEQTAPLVFEVKLSAKDLWKFSMYYSYKGFKGLFNLIFTAAAVYLLITDWNTVSVWYRVLLVVCAMMFTVWHPCLLYLKAAKQAKAPAIKIPTKLSFSREGIVVSQGGERLELTWEAIALVEQVKSLLIVYMDRVHAYLLPDSLTGEMKTELCGLIREMLPPGRRKKV